MNKHTKFPPWLIILLIILIVPGSIAIARVGLESHFSKLTTLLILIPILIILSWPMMFKPRGGRK
jgi:hypothetical protein